MRVLLEINFPHKPFNAAVKDGSASAKMKKILEQCKPESAYFTELDGHRCGLLVVNIEDASQIPAYAEPWFLTFEADVKLRPVMTVEDLGRSGLEPLGKKWG